MSLVEVNSGNEVFENLVSKQYTVETNSENLLKPIQLCIKPTSSNLSDTCLLNKQVTINFR